MTDVIASVRELDHTYLPGTPMATVALRGASLVVRRGETAALIGHSGAGKSTLLHCLNGLLRPSRTGQVLVFGHDVGEADCDIIDLRRRVGLVFQHPHHQLFERYVGDDVAYGPRQLDLSRDQVRERVQWAMSAVGLDFQAFVDRPTFSLSGGEMRRVALAGILAMQPQLLILDEATSGLDPQGRRQVHAVLRRLRKEGMTILIASNDMDEVAELADHVTVLHEGRTLLAGSTREVFAQREALRHHGLSSPTPSDIVYALRDAGLPVEREAITAREAEEAIWQAMIA